MKVLELNNHAVYQFTDESTIRDLVTVVTSFAEVDPYLNGITTELLQGATFDGERVEDAVVTEVKADSDGVGNVIIHIATRDKSSDEIIMARIRAIEQDIADLAEEILG